MLLSAGAALILGVLVVSAVEIVRASWFAGVLGGLPWLRALEGVVLQYAATLLFIGGVWLVSYFIPNAKTRFRDVWAGAVLTGLLWRGAFAAFSWYVGYSTRLASIHGSITAVVVFLLYVYVSAAILLYGVEFTAAHARLRARRPEWMPAAPPQTSA
jgi:membrane protein